jgi:WD40 repeat protein
MSSATHVKCRSSASMMNSNLAGNGRYVAYAHSVVAQSEVWVLDADDASLTQRKPVSTALHKSAFSGKEPVRALRYTQEAEQEMLVAVTSGGTVVYLSEDGEELLHTTQLKPSDAPSWSFAAVANDNEHVLVGGHGGVVASLDSQCNVVGRFSPHKGEVTGMDCDRKLGLLCSVDTLGHVVFSRKTDKGYEVVSDFKAIGDMGTAVRISRHGYAVVTFVTGHVRLYNCAKLSLDVEVVASTRSISCVAVHPVSPQFMIGSLDTFYSIWTLPTPQKQAIELISSEKLGDAMLTGCAFTGNSSQFCSFVCYDSRYISNLPRPS